MYRLLSLIFLLILLVGAAARSLDLSIYEDGYYFRYDFPRFSEKSWFQFETGKRQLFREMMDNLKARASD